MKKDKQTKYDEFRIKNQLLVMKITPMIPAISTTRSKANSIYFLRDFFCKLLA